MDKNKVQSPKVVKLEASKDKASFTKLSDLKNYTKPVSILPNQTY